MNSKTEECFDSLIWQKGKINMLILFLKIMFIISIVSFGLFFFLGKVRVNGFLSNKVSHAFLGAIWFTFITDLVLFIPVGIIMILANLK